MGKAGSSSVPRLLSSSTGSSKLTKAEKRRLNTRYSRGEGNTSKGVTKPDLKRSIKRQEAKISAAERRAAQAEVLQPTEPGYLEAEGPLERTSRVRQSQLASLVDEQTAAKAYDVRLDQLGPYRVAFTPNGRRVLLGGRKGHVAVAQWAGGFRVLSEIQASSRLFLWQQLAHSSSIFYLTPLATRNAHQPSPAV
jgi:U3 small nucleolar RNA-associated protein 7